MASSVTEMKKKKLKKIYGIVIKKDRDCVWLKVPRGVYFNGQFFRRDFVEVSISIDLPKSYLERVPKAEETEILEITYTGDFGGVIKIKEIKMPMVSLPPERIEEELPPLKEWIEGDPSMPLLLESILSAPIISIPIRSRK